MKALVFAVGIPSLNNPTRNREDRRPVTTYFFLQETSAAYLCNIRWTFTIAIRQKANLHLTTVSVSYAELLAKLNKQGVMEQKLPNPSSIYLSEDEAKLANPYIFLLVTHYADLKKERALPRK